MANGQTVRFPEPFCRSPGAANFLRQCGQPRSCENHGPILTGPFLATIKGVMQAPRLEHGSTTNDPGVTDLLSDPFLRAYKDDPRFIAFAQKVGVVPKAAPTP